LHRARSKANARFALVSEARRDKNGRLASPAREPIMNGMRWIDGTVGFVIALAKWLVLPLAFLLLAQWPLREIVQQYSREANDLGQILFALYVAVALSCATRRDAHLATDVVAHRYPARFRTALLRVALAITLVPWSLYVLATGATTAWRSIATLEAFPETFNSGYFLVKLAVCVLAALLLLQSLVIIVHPAPPESAE